MQTIHPAVERQFLAVAAALGAEPGEEEYYRGTLEHAPFLLKLMSAEPPEYMLKFRMTEPHTEPSDWHEKLPEEYAQGAVRCELDGDYLYLWIDDAAVLSAEAIAALAIACVRDHAAYFPPADGYCYQCGRTGVGALVQASNLVASWCDECRERRRQELLAERQKLNALDARTTVLLPLALLASGLGWALFWAGYDWAFQGANGQALWAPRIVVGVVILAVGLAVGWPVGWVVHRSGASRRLSPEALAVGGAVLIAALGELLYAAYVVYRHTGTFDPPTILRVASLLAFSGSVIYLGYKLMFIIVVGCVIREVAKPREVLLRV